MQSTVVAVGPTWEPVSLAEARAHCRVDINDDDLLLSGLITAAREHIEIIGWVTLPQQTLDLWLEDGFEDDEIKLPRPPAISVTHVKYYDTADVEYTLSTAVYYANVIGKPAEVHLKYGQNWPSTTLRDYNAVNVRYVAGYATPEAIPQRYKQAILLLVGHWYENRESAISGTISREIDFSVTALVRADRQFQY